MRDPPFIPTPLPLLKKRSLARFDPSVKKKVFSVFNFDAGGVFARGRGEKRWKSHRDTFRLALSGWP